MAAFGMTNGKHISEKQLIKGSLASGRCYFVRGGHYFRITVRPQEGMNGNVDLDTLWRSVSSQITMPDILGAWQCLFSDLPLRII